MPNTARGSADEGYLSLARRVVEQLLDALGRVGLEEFRAQDTHYDRDCRVGRELLYLAANDEWNRGSTEVVELDSADTVETTIHVNVDLDLVAHEAFRTKLDRFWVPLVLLPPPRAQDPVEARLPPPVRIAASPTVVDSAGAAVPVLPQTEARRWVAAALAEILLNMAPPVPPSVGSGVPRPVVTREQRLWLSAALYRVLADGEGARRELPDAQLRGTGRAQAARQEVHALIRDHLGLLGPDDGSDPRRTRRALLVQRAARIVHALGNPTTLVVVGMTPSALPSAFSVQLPARRLLRTDLARWRDQRARLDLDVMLPFASADREVVVKLPEGVSYARDEAGGIGVHAEVEVKRPRYLGQLVELVEQIVTEPPPSPPVVQALADVAHTRVEASREVYRHHRLTAAEAGRAAPETVVSAELDRLDEALATHDAGKIRAAWAAAGHLHDDGSGGAPNLFRVLECEAVGPHAVDVRTYAIEDPLVRDSPARARVRLDVVVHDSAPLHTARYSGWMSLVIVTTVLLDTWLFKAQFNAEVLAGLLTLFAVIQAGRVEHPNRNTLHGLLSAAGSWLILASILPTVLLGVTLAFTGGQDSPAQALAGAALVAQLALQVTMYVGPVSGRIRTGRSPRLQLRTESIPDYARIDVVHSRWWASTTAGALLLGREAHGYVVWQRDAEVAALIRPRQRIALPQNPGGIARRGWDSLVRLTGPGAMDGEEDAPTARPRPVRPAVGSAIASALRVVRPGEGPPNILALARSGTERHGLTFIVFREEPRPEWQEAIGARRVELEADQLTAREAPIGDVDVFLGMPLPLQDAAGYGRRQQSMPSPLQDAAGDGREHQGLPYPRPGTLAEHPLAKVLAVTRTHRRLVLDVQLPAPPPRGGARNRRWLRVRIGLRDGEVATLSTFLAALDSAVREDCPPGLDLLVQVAPQTPPRRFAGAPAPDGPPGVLLAEELNVVRGLTRDPDAREWLVVALYGYGRSGLEADMLHWFAQRRPRLDVIGMSTALLHGTSVVFLLGHQVGGPDEGEDVPGESWSGPSEDGVTVLVHTWVTAAELGTPPGLGGGALLRVHARATDRPGAFADMFDQLGRSLARVAGLPKDDIPLPVWHVLLDVADGRLANYLFTVQVPPALSVVGSWHRPEWAAAERTLRQVLTARLPDGTPVAEGGASADAVVSMRLIGAGTGDPAPAAGGVPVARQIDVREAQDNRRIH